MSRMLYEKWVKIIIAGTVVPLLKNINVREFIHESVESFFIGLSFSNFNLYKVRHFARCQHYSNFFQWRFLYYIVYNLFSLHIWLYNFQQTHYDRTPFKKWHEISSYDASWYLQQPWGDFSVTKYSNNVFNQTATKNWHERILLVS